MNRIHFLMSASGHGMSSSGGGSLMIGVALIAPAIVSH
jgi:hypothetical protein